MVALFALVVLSAAVGAFPVGAAGEQGSQPGWAPAGRLDVGAYHTCALLADGKVRCWGFNGDGQLGYGNTNTIGDDETPSATGPVNLGPGRTATAISAGDYHTCALLDDGSVRCWGLGGDGQLGYGDRRKIGDDEAPGSAGPVDLGPGRTAVAITAGPYHTCAVLDDGSVRCWGYGRNGQLGYGNMAAIGDDETPGSAGPVNLGAGRTAVAISAGGRHTCARLDDGNVRCWGYGFYGHLGYGNQKNIGDDETPDSAGPVNLGPGRTATAISGGDYHTCALLEDGSVRCWGEGGHGQLGYGNQGNIGDDETPDTVGPVNLGAGRTTVAISSGGRHTCARLDDGSVRCWGFGGPGQLGYGNQSNIGDDETPDTVGPVNLGAGRTTVAISSGGRHTCARLDDGSVRCWGYGGNGRLGYCNENSVGDDEPPGLAGTVDLEPPGVGCAPFGGGGTGTGGGSGTTSGTGSGQSGGGPVGSPSPIAPPGGDSVDPLALEALRARRLRTCLAGEKRQARSKRGRARKECLKRYGRSPGRVRALKGRTRSRTEIVLSFAAPGTDGVRPPAARTYLLKQSRASIRDERDFTRAQTLCNGSCRFSVTRVGTRINLTITDLRPTTTYYYAIAARDNVSRRLGRRSTAVKARTR